MEQFRTQKIMSHRCKEAIEKKKSFCPKFFCVNKYLRSTKIWGTKNMLGPNWTHFLDPNFGLTQEILWVRKILEPQNILGQKENQTKIIWYKKISGQ